MGILIWDPFSPFYIKSLGVKISPIYTAILKFKRKYFDNKQAIEKASKQLL